MQEYIQVPTWLRGIANHVYVTEKNGFLPKIVLQNMVPVLIILQWNGYWRTKRIYYKRNKLLLIVMILMKLLL